MEKNSAVVVVVGIGMMGSRMANRLHLAGKLTNDIDIS